jgi:hypothetical protein
MICVDYCKDIVIIINYSLMVMLKTKLNIVKKIVSVWLSRMLIL